MRSGSGLPAPGSRLPAENPVIPTAAGSDARAPSRTGVSRIPKHRERHETESLLHGRAQTMLNLWLLAAGAFALAAVALARRARRRASDVSAQSVSEEWLSDLRGQRHEGP